MTIEEHNYLRGENPPLPNTIIDLNEVHKLNFIQTSFREYLCVYGDYIICVYPFAIKVEWSFRMDGKPLTYDYFKLSGVRSSYHHHDFLSGEIDTDPCEIYEMVSGIRIHHHESDSNFMNNDYSENIKLFESEIISQRRNNKINELGV